MLMADEAGSPVPNASDCVNRSAHAFTQLRQVCNSSWILHTRQQRQTGHARSIFCTTWANTRR